MIGIFFIFCFVLFFGSILYVMNFVLSEKTKQKMKLMPFECGIENHLKTRFSFSIHFFFITIVFIFFDMEILILYNMVNILSNSWYWFFFFVLYLFFMLGTLLFEWSMDFIKWKN